MRVALDPDDHGYANWVKYPHCQPYLNGVKLIDCVMADEGLGEVTVYKRIDGEFVVVDDHLELETFKGDVRIDLEPSEGKL